MTKTAQTDERRVTPPASTDRVVMDVEAIRRALAEGQELGRAFQRATAGMRVLTADDLRTRFRG